MAEKPPRVDVSAAASLARRTLATRKSLSDVLAIQLAEHLRNAIQGIMDRDTLNARLRSENEGLIVEYRKMHRQQRECVHAFRDERFAAERSRIAYVEALRVIDALLAFAVDPELVTEEVLASIEALRKFLNEPERT